MKFDKKIQSQIEALTSNEDFRQDLWVAHLNGQSNLPDTLKSIQSQHDKIEGFQIKLHQYAIGALPPSISQLIENFHGIERSILYMLIVGYTVDDISNHHGTSRVRVCQAIGVIQKHSVWNRLLTSV